MGFFFTFDVKPTDMKKIFTLIAAVIVCSVQGVYAQRYLEEVFDDVTVTSSVTYGVNATVLLYQLAGEAVPEELKMDIYEPAGDTETNRPVVLYFHTGNFLPHPQNQSPSGLRTDSTAVEICSRLARMGYVAASCDYRLGWNPVAPTQDERVFTLINAAYRGVQDCRTAIRFFRMTEAEQSNPYGIDPEKVVVWGQGTGGYISFAAASIDQYDDIVLPKFIRDVEVSPGVIVPVPMVLEEVNGDIFGTSFGINPNDGDTLCYPNHLSYDSDFNVAVNMGGACGDISWIDADDVPMISFQAPSDPFAPYTSGVLIVPGVNLPVVEVSGAYDVQEQLNLFGNNDVFLLADNYEQGIEYTNAANANNNGFNGLYPLIRPAGSETDSAPWEWWASTNPNNTAGLLTNPDMSADKGRAFIDSIMGYAIPRVTCVLNLPGNACTVGVDESEETTLAVFPNPARENVTFRANAPIEAVSIYDLTGKRVFFRAGMNTSLWQMNESLPARGMYTVEIITDRGRAVEKLIVE
jgi:acetyl esterase/lipase